MNHGGKRNGAGRRPIFDKTKLTQIRVNQVIWEAIPAPKAAWVRGAIEEKAKRDNLTNSAEARAMEGQKKMEIAFESFWKNNKKLNNILNGVNHGIMDKISIGEFAQLCFKEGFNADKFGGIE